MKHVNFHSTEDGCQLNKDHVIDTNTIPDAVYRIMLMYFSITLERPKRTKRKSKLNALTLLTITIRNIKVRNCVDKFLVEIHCNDNPQKSQ